MMDFRKWGPRQKAFIVSGFFAAIGIFALTVTAPYSRYALPLALFYAVIAINTFYSVRFFSALVPAENQTQHLMDALLVVWYILLGFYIWAPVPFAFFALCLFITATAKYALLVDTFPHREALKRKILIDIIGIAWCVLALGGILLGYPYESVWIYTLGFAAANAYLLFLKPMYRL